jgi:hypothetical protein
VRSRGPTAYHPTRCEGADTLADALLFTSIPPKITRRNGAGEDIGPSYQADCIASWIEAGFRPATINARSESFSAEPPIRRVTVERDACEMTGRPHPYFGDLLSAIAGETDGPFALVNADIVIPPSAGLSRRVTSLERGEVIFTRRLDVARVGAPGKPFFYGYDFFAAHGAEAVALAKSQLVFGAPWWDHFFPLAMHLHGHRLTQLEPTVTHLHHAERWDWANYRKLGNRFVAELQPLVADGPYTERLQRILAKGKGSPLRRRERRDRLVFDRMSQLNVAVIERLAPAPASSGVRTPLQMSVQDRLLRLSAAGDSFSATDHTLRRAG